MIRQKYLRVMLCKLQFIPYPWKENESCGDVKCDRLFARFIVSVGLQSQLGDTAPWPRFNG